MLIATIAVLLILITYGALVGYFVRRISKKSHAPQITATIYALIVCGIAVAVLIYSSIARNGKLSLIILPFVASIILVGNLIRADRKSR